MTLPTKNASETISAMGLETSGNAIVLSAATTARWLGPARYNARNVNKELAYFRLLPITEIGEQTE